MRVIGIAGVFHCGSTALGRLFDAVPGVASLGEVAWITDKWRRVTVLEHRYDPLAGKDGYVCTGCHKPDCPIYPLGIGDPAPEPKDVYRMFAERAGVDIVVPGDKVIEKYNDLTPPGTMDAIILYRHPSAWTESNVRRYNRTYRFARTYYLERYRGMIEWAHPRRKIYVSWEWLLKRPEINFAKLCAALDLPEVHPLPKLGDIPYHHIWGDKEGQRKMELLPPPNLAALEERYQPDSALRELYSALLERSLS